MPYENPCREWGIFHVLKTRKLERFSVNQEPVSSNLNRAHAEWYPVHIQNGLAVFRDDFRAQLTEIGHPWLP